MTPNPKPSESTSAGGSAGAGSAAGAGTQSATSADARPLNIVVTGAAGGIGHALAARMVQGGARVVMTDVQDEVLERAAALGAHGVVSDIATESGVQLLVATARAELGSIDVWFGNAGIERGGGLETSEADWSRTHEINVMAHVRTSRLLVPEWVERGRGRYIVTASAAGLLTMLGSPSYSVSKHGAVAFAEWLSATYRHKGDVVQAICPQGVQTQMLEQPGLLKDLLSHDTALTPEAVAELAWQSLQHDRFLILPHPEVGDYYARRATDTDSWLGGMNRLQQKVEAF
ncbi:MAG: SDR family oxidoreductase [Leucobacter sp.]|nr:SDR family oxidoreductase [Leucobacter sp.]